MLERKPASSARLPTMAEVVDFLSSRSPMMWSMSAAVSKSHLPFAPSHLVHLCLEHCNFVTFRLTKRLQNIACKKNSDSIWSLNIP